MSTKHTPGPWNLIWSGNEKYPYPLTILADNDGVWIARDGTISNPEDARLIAAAPDMLEALRQMVVNSEADGKSYRDCHKKAIAAIAKAEGRSLPTPSDQ